MVGMDEYWMTILILTVKAGLFAYTDTRETIVYWQIRSFVDFLLALMWGVWIDVSNRIGLVQKLVQSVVRFPDPIWCCFHELSRSSSYVAYIPIRFLRLSRILIWRRRLTEHPDAKACKSMLLWEMCHCVYVVCMWYGKIFCIRIRQIPMHGELSGIACV